MLVGLDHVQLACPRGGEPAGIEFYAGVLGLEHVSKPEPMASRGGCWFRGRGFELHLGVDDDFRPARKAHPALLVVDLDGLVARIAGSGGEVRWDDDLPGVRRCYVDDPFGNRIELIATGT
jgi:catechol 2,3-dioxygenase-like lactoylglutathione lyase family enzyme